MQQEVEKKNQVIGNSIGVAYGDSRQTNLLEFNDFIDNDELKKVATYTYWEDRAKNMSCDQRLEMGETFGIMLSEAFKNRWPSIKLLFPISKS